MNSSSVEQPAEHPSQTQGVSGEAVEALTVEDFHGVYHTLLAEIREYLSRLGTPETVLVRLHQCLADVTKGGKLTRGLMPLEAGRRLLCGRLTQTQATDLAVIGWTIELLHAAYLIEDDIMDASIFRRAGLCRYLQPNIGMSAIADACMVRSCVRHLLHSRFEQHPQYLEMVHLLDTMSFHTDLGQLTDVHIANTTFRAFHHFTPEMNRFIITNKTAYYTVYFPIAFTLYYLRLSTPNNMAYTKDISLQLGVYFQITDDYLDVYGDPASTGKVGTDVHEKKCAWVITEALRRCRSEERGLLEEAYSNGDLEQVKALFDGIGMQKVYVDLANNSYKGIVDALAGIDESEGLVRGIFELFLSKIHGRVK
ncbi:FPP/GGPP synthase family protein [Aspergillus aculeatinus CBS 121060]|uniref:Terpenoid synthase n=1 Tax=Aspergillus aculeatinus CBS 121060 TaxID=1448322 RepID=A0ACD1HPX6_9EURO|nr:terpenoid synthase [Aspergillus aculeatinus CBS 121060]RAH75645.1 terpenoid synthase [Aspergillus aculeatinus CBS 121060]